MVRSEAVIDLDAIRDNVTLLRSRTPAEVMAVVKADGYGHGLVPSARAALAGGASWLGVAFLEEALALRRAGITAPVLSWLATPGEDVAAGVAADVDLSASAPWAIAEIAAAAREAGRPAQVHLKIDTGLSRGGAPAADWPDLVTAAAKAAAAGDVQVIGIWSHFAYADAPGHPTIARQVAEFTEAVEVARRLGVDPPLRHLANSAATLTLPAAHFDLVRPGIAVYGLTPVPPERHGLDPGDDAALVGRAGQAGPGRQRRLVRARLHDRAGDRSGPGPARVRRRGAAQRDLRRPAAARRPAPDDLRPGVHGPVRRGRRRRHGDGR